MKIISVVVFLGAMIFSWMLVHANSPISESMHVGIQNDLKTVIAEYVTKNLPTSKNLRFEKFWTETIKRDKVKASFLYSFEDTSQENGQTTIKIEGYAMLEKGEETPETVTWNLTSLQIKDSHVDFQDPIQITAGKGETTGE